jgi:hypothetical protein
MAFPNIWNHKLSPDEYDAAVAGERARLEAAAKPARPSARSARPAQPSPVEAARQEGRAQAAAEAAEVCRLCLAAGRPDMIATLAGRSPKEASAALGEAMWHTAFSKARSGRPNGNVNQGQR